MVKYKNAWKSAWKNAWFGQFRTTARDNTATRGSWEKGRPGPRMDGRHRALVKPQGAANGKERHTRKHEKTTCFLTPAQSTKMTAGHTGHGLTMDF